MYEVPLRNCSLFSSLKPKFLDALMASCKTDMFLPHVRARGAVGICIGVERALSLSDARMASCKTDMFLPHVRAMGAVGISIGVEGAQSLSDARMA